MPPTWDSSKYWKIRDTHWRLDKHNEDEGEDAIMGQSTKMLEDGMQCKDLGKVRNDVEDLLGLRGELELEVGKWGLLLVS
jgi:hypothetical protein